MGSVTFSSPPEQRGVTPETRGKPDEENTMDAILGLIKSLFSSISAK
ncbi:hypothetical protein ABZ319_37335 [Nocardia sp. NPDC005978]